MIDKSLILATLFFNGWQIIKKYIKLFLNYLLQFFLLLLMITSQNWKKTSREKRIWNRIFLKIHTSWKCKNIDFQKMLHKNAPFIEKLQTHFMHLSKRFHFNKITIYYILIIHEMVEKIKTGVDRLLLISKLKKSHFKRKAPFLFW